MLLNSERNLCVSWLLLLSHYFTNCYFSFSLKGSPLSLLYCIKLSIFSLSFQNLPLHGISRKFDCYYLCYMDAPNQLPPILVWIESTKWIYDLSFWHLLIPVQPLIQHGQSSSFSSPSCLSQGGEITILLPIQVCRLGILFDSLLCQRCIDHFKNTCLSWYTVVRKQILSLDILYTILKNCYSTCCILE